jgi:hypothetical protein
MSNEFGYIPESPEQSFGNNKGIFTPTDIYDLTRADKYTNYGQLELIETQTVSSAVAQVDFTDIKEDIYNVHFLTASDMKFSSTGIGNLGVRFFNSGVIDTSGYQIAYLRFTATGSITEVKSTNVSALRINTYSGNTSSTTGLVNGYSYFYNLGDSTKYSFQTTHSTLINYDNNYASNFGSGVSPQTSVVDGIRLYDSSSGNDIANGTFSLYGIKEYS